MSHCVDTTIQFSGLKSGVYTYNFTLDDSFFSEYKNEKILGAEVIFDVRMEKKERLLMFFFTYDGKVRTTCDRCLEEMELPLNGEETLCVKFSDTERSDDDDVVFLPERADKIDLSQWMYEYVAVAIPMRCIHPDDENGKSTCDAKMLEYLDMEGDNKNEDVSAKETTDPRWDALKKLK